MHLLPTEPKLADDTVGNVRIPNKIGLVLSTEAARKRGGTPQRIVRGKNEGKDRSSRQLRKHACSHVDRVDWNTRSEYYTVSGTVLRDVFVVVMGRKKVGRRLGAVRGMGGVKTWGRNKKKHVQ
jgi:hypothetical protein